MRINQGQEFVIGGYTIVGKTFDALVFGYYDGSDLLYIARTRNGFTPRLREELVKRFAGLETNECPFDNLPEARSGRWGAGPWHTYARSNRAYGSYLLRVRLSRRGLMTLKVRRGGRTLAEGTIRVR